MTLEQRLDAMQANINAAKKDIARAEDQLFLMRFDLRTQNLATMTTTTEYEAKPYHFQDHVFGLPRPAKQGMNHTAAPYRVCWRCGRSDVSLTGEGWPPCK